MTLQQFLKILNDIDEKHTHLFLPPKDFDNFKILVAKWGALLPPKLKVLQNSLVSLPTLIKAPEGLPLTGWESVPSDSFNTTFLWTFALSTPSPSLQEEQERRNAWKPPTEVDESGMKFQAKMMLCDTSKRLSIPTVEEWVGLNLLERDDELIRGKEQQDVDGLRRKVPQEDASQTETE